MMVDGGQNNDVKRDGAGRKPSLTPAPLCDCAMQITEAHREMVSFQAASISSAASNQL